MVTLVSRISQVPLVNRLICVAFVKDIQDNCLYKDDIKKI